MCNEVGYMKEDPPDSPKQGRLSHRKALILWVFASGLGWLVVMAALLFLI